MTQPSARIDRQFTVAADHPAFSGHFEGAPVLPGVVLLTQLMQALDDLPGWTDATGASICIDAAKFLAPVGPGQVLQLRLTRQGGSVDFEFARGRTLVARGRVSAAP
jgi:3-hydroxyacyl-[acyl-carrier-protein] dehydratase